MSLEGGSEPAGPTLSQAGRGAGAGAPGLEGVKAGLGSVGLRGSWGPWESAPGQGARQTDSARGPSACKVQPALATSSLMELRFFSFLFVSCVCDASFCKCKQEKASGGGGRGRERQMERQTGKDVDRKRQTKRQTQR